ncbi:MAG TPA: F0F1 ATP synthase subunit B [Candidatus Omnitrophota bacterium]|nr:F0F1 ATP synthase subunit B [Candidatus Omnitrophota bacterium]
MELLKLLSANEILAQIVCFLILLAIMRKVFWSKVLRALDARKERIAKDLKDIEALRSSTESLKSNYEMHLSRIEEEARERMRQAIEEARIAADGIRKKAELDASSILEKSKDNIKAEISEAKDAIKNDIVDLTIAVTEKIIQEKYSEADDRRLIEDYLNGLEKR